MFNPPPAGGELSSKLESPASAEFGVQQVGLSQAPFLGVWCLPSLSPLVPLRVQDGASKANSSLAKFILAANSAGVPVVGENFTDLQVTITQQWSTYLRANGDSDNVLPMQLSIEAHPELVHVEVTPESVIPLFRLKPMVEKLNAYRAGLGWWAWFLIEDAGFCYPMYSFSFQRHAAYFAGWFDGDSDEGAAEFIRENQAVNGTVAELQEQFSGVWPSHFAAAAGGHGWMYGVKEGASQHRPRRMTLKEAKEVLKACSDPEIQSVVAAGLDLCNASRRHRLGEWDQSHGDVPDGHEMEGLDALGSTCFVVWDTPEVCMEVVEHSERWLQESEYRDSFRTWRISTEDPKAMRAGVRALKAFIDLHSCLGRFMSFFKEDSK